MFAGNDIRLSGAVYDRLKRALLNQSDVSLQAAQDALRKAESEVFLYEVIPGLIPPGWTYQEFKQNGPTLPNFQEIQRNISQAREGCDYLLCGFDERGLPHIVQLPAQQTLVNCDRWGYGALGSGASIAEHHLSVCGYSRALSARAAVYHLCAAKFFAESGFVGPTTRIAVLMKDQRLLTMDDEPVRALWSREGRPCIPKNLESKLPQFSVGPSTPSVVRGLGRRAVKQAPQPPTSDL
jgi:hypothetical protein